MINAIIFGASGMVGEGVLLEALKHPDVQSVLVIGRRSCGRKHPKLRETIHQDFFDYSAIKDSLAGYNACLFCLGVSSIGMNEADYTRTTYDLTMHAARTLSAANPAMTFCYVSGAGTDSSERGRSMWARVKGKTENDLRTLPFKAAYAFRPGFIKPSAGQQHAFTIARMLGVLHPIWKTFLPKYVCTMEDLGRSMIRAADQGYSKSILENSDIRQLANT
ncbi:MAG: epimerase [Ignavibacteriae bacterium]|nr:epimerase [Ignavibacteriota bacterium]